MLLIVSGANLKPLFKECQTDGFLIEGAHGWTPTMYIRLVQDFGLEMEVKFLWTCPRKIEFVEKYYNISTLQSDTLNWGSTTAHHLTILIQYRVLYMRH